MSENHYEFHIEPDKTKYSPINTTFVDSFKVVDGNESSNSIENETTKPIERRKVNNGLILLHNLLSINCDTYKYYYQKYALFSKYDDGIILDYEGFFSATPENIAIHQAKILQGDLIIDATVGCGGNVVHLPTYSKHVIAIDISLAKVRMAMHNSSIYNVDDKITFVHGNSLHVMETLESIFNGNDNGQFPELSYVRNNNIKKLDTAIISVPWGGVKYINNPVFIITMIPYYKTMKAIIHYGVKMANMVGLVLPRTTSLDSLYEFANEIGGKYLALEYNYSKLGLKCATFYITQYKEAADKLIQLGKEMEKENLTTLYSLSVIKTVGITETKTSLFESSITIQ